LNEKSRLDEPALAGRLIPARLTGPLWPAGLLQLCIATTHRLFSGKQAHSGRWSCFGRQEDPAACTEEAVIRTRPLWPVAAFWSASTFSTFN